MPARPHAGESVGRVDAVADDQASTRAGGTDPRWATRGYPRRYTLFAQRSEARAHLFREELWLFPGREMAAFIEPVVVDEVVGISAFCPAARGLIELVGEDADRERD